jgi:hypothetical protein
LTIIFSYNKEKKITKSINRNIVIVRQRIGMRGGGGGGRMLRRNKNKRQNLGISPPKSNAEIEIEIEIETYTHILIPNTHVSLHNTNCLFFGGFLQISSQQLVGYRVNYLGLFDTFAFCHHYVTRFDK